jgi:hypothetical protein
LRTPSFTLHAKVGRHLWCLSAVTPCLLLLLLLLERPSPIHPSSMLLRLHGATKRLWSLPRSEVGRLRWQLLCMRAGAAVHAASRLRLLRLRLLLVGCVCCGQHLRE